MKASDFDIVIVGAGMVGACAAHALASNGFKIALLEAVEAAGETVGPDDEYDLRVSAISPRSRAILEGLGVWQALEPKRVCYYEQMFIWHENGSASLAFDAVDLVRDNLGAIVENRLLQNALRRACERQPRIEWFVPDSVDQLLRNDRAGVELTLASGARLRAGLLIAADGRASPTRALAGIETSSGRYGQTAFVANVDTENDTRTRPGSDSWQPDRWPSCRWLTVRVRSYGLVTMISRNESRRSTMTTSARRWVGLLNSNSVRCGQPAHV